MAMELESGVVVSKNSVQAKFLWALAIFALKPHFQSHDLP